ncbi:helix-turn-helix domain-containing protein [Enterococcus sp. LJL128]
MSEYKHNELIAERIQLIATEKNLTINRIATLAGLTTSTVNSVFTGKSKNPTISTIKNVCEALDISVSDFFDFEPYNTTMSKEETPEEILNQLKSLSSEVERLEEKFKEQLGTQ